MSDSNFPCDGIWLVVRGSGSRSESCIMQLGEKPTIYPFANMIMASDDLARFLVKQKIIKDGSSAMDVSYSIIKELAEIAKNETEPVATEKTTWGTQICTSCKGGTDKYANFCKNCGKQLK